MIRIFGLPTFAKTFETMDISWEKCVGKCRTDINCSIQLPGNKCPTSNPLVPGPSYFTQTIKNQVYKTKVSFDSKSKQYNLTYSVISCPKNTKLFQRGETTVVCIGLFFFEGPRCNNSTQASALCKTQKGTLTGPANSKEYEYIQAISKSSQYTSNPDSFNYLTYWIDGVGINTEYAFADPTHDGSSTYTWTLGAPLDKKAGYCLHNPGPQNANVMDNPCNFSTCCQDQVCWRGALCRVPPTIE